MGLTKIERAREATATKSAPAVEWQPSARPREPAAGARTNASVGVRELRQNLSVYLDRVKLGEALNVTEHGHIVAVLRPAPWAASPLDLLIAQGLATPARRAIQELPHPRPLDAGARPLSQVLEDMRAEERY